MALPFVAVMFLVFALFVAARVPRGAQAIWLCLTIFTFGCCVLGLIGLITRFGNYRLEGLIVLPLDWPRWIGDVLARLTLDQFIRFRLWSLVCFVISVIGFSLSYSIQRWRRQDKVIVALAAGFTAFLLWYYDPEHLFALYAGGTDLLGQPHLWERRLYELGLYDQLAVGALALILAYAVGRIFWLWKRSSIPQKRAQALCVGFGNGLLAAFFLFLFCFGPAKVLNARAVTTTFLPVAGYPVFDITLLLAVPFIGLAVLAAVVTSILRFGFLGTWHMGTHDLERQISVANQAVRLALHSFKNRFLAVQMAMDLAAAHLQGLADERAERSRGEILGARRICEEALAQLDTLHVQAGRLQAHPDRWQLTSLLEEARHRCASRYANAAVETGPVDPSVAVWGDREHLVTVLENLLQNAVEAVGERSPAGGAPAIRVEIGREYEWGYVRISDNGPGISRKDLRRIFRPFFTTKPARSNWGMGLAYCHRVLKAHGGFINIRSRQFQGTTVEVVLRRR